MGGKTKLLSMTMHHTHSTCLTALGLVELKHFEMERRNHKQEDEPDAACYIQNSNMHSKLPLFNLTW